MRVAIVGGGPGGLFAAILLKQADPGTEVVLWERNRPGDTFGFGVVFSDATLRGIDAVDPLLLRALTGHGVHWDDIEVRIHGERWRCGGNGMAAISRAALLGLLAAEAGAAGVDLRFESELGDLSDQGGAPGRGAQGGAPGRGALSGYDLVIGADGANSTVRRHREDAFGPTVDVASVKFIWLATTALFTGLTFLHQRGPDGVFAVHAYPYGPEGSTFIVETDEVSWRRAGLDRFDVTQAPGPSDLESKVYLEELFAEHLGGHPLLVNNSRWSNFRTLRCRSWHEGNVVILGDAAHTAHFSVGSGTKMAMEDAAELVRAVSGHPGDVPAALAAYEAARRPAVEKIQGSARPSLSWWEHFGRYHDHLEAAQFVFHFFSRSIPRGKLARRDPGFVAAVEEWWLERHGASPLQAPLEVGGQALAGRVVSVETGGGRVEVRRSRPSDVEVRRSRPSDVEVRRSRPSDVEVRRSRPSDVEVRRRGLDTSFGDEVLPFRVAGQSGPAGEWGVWLDAPEYESGLAGALAELEEGARAGAAIVAVAGGSAVTRALLCEEARMIYQIPALLVDDGLSADEAATVVLSGRADLVGASPAVAATWIDQ